MLMTLFVVLHAFLPCRGVVPGARFDPYGPPGVPGFERNRFGRCACSTSNQSAASPMQNIL
jgi:hypothetical protein